MTFRRFLHRNGLDKGDYIDGGDYRNLLRPVLQPFPPKDRFPDCTDARYVEMLHEHIDLLGKALFGWNQWRQQILGDLRRLEADGQDERALCREIARLTEVDPDDIAAVLRVWMTT
jgi:flagellar biosynthesis/type III secretory pathway M-ring protein FliF/YscJ